MNTPNTSTETTCNSSESPKVIIVGGGMSGIAALYRCRQHGISAKIIESGPKFGGVWYWNRYPGARVDSEWPFYQLNMPEVYNTWSFSERFPDHRELLNYMEHINNTLDLSKDTIFNAKVVGAEFDAAASRWTVRTASGLAMTSKYLILATGLLHKKYVPEFPGLVDYKGQTIHSTEWPEHIDLNGKRVGLFGSGATAVQIVQELAKETASRGSLTVLMRRPSTCINMKQQKLSTEDQDKWRGYLATLFAAGRKSWTGFPLATTGKMIFSTPPDEREAILETLWNRGGFNLSIGGFLDTSINMDSNRILYDFWCRKVRARMTDPFKMDILAPLNPVYPIGAKRSPLENDYYESIDMKHVEVVPLNDNPLVKFIENGVVLQDGTQRSFDVVVLATGFDSFTGSLSKVGIKSIEGVDLGTIWESGVRTYLGISMNGFPNVFIVYSPQAPTAFSNGPTILECQCDLIVESIVRLEKEGAIQIEPTIQAEQEWEQTVAATVDGSLLTGTNSWWNGGNIPGKKIQNLTLNTGIAMYEEICRDKLKNWSGFKVRKG